ncbi:hypothetical protein C2I27_04250 [Priestia megaterium]|uniref:hypothetical protein n=1 Tax=Priestia megaterium TaxID=1404 RepID=UPI000D5218F1|nr:hypothetical protein [Priestia megaterium]MEB2276873.1 hypothetical protein [Bacillus sp. ILBB4]PVC75104.1 hypothetical protein C2I27_04250 [Priestia megaterium]
MQVNQSNQKVEVNIDFAELIRRQDDLEKELTSLRNMYHEMKKENDRTINRIHKRIDKVEKELTELRATINELKSSIDNVQSSVNIVEKHVTEINVKQDVAITAQDKFIGQLWKAFFALLGVITAAGAAIVAFMK